MCSQDAAFVPKCSGFFTQFLARPYEPSTWIFRRVNYQSRARKLLLACSTDVSCGTFHPLVGLSPAVCLCSQACLVWVSVWQVIDLPLTWQLVKSPQKCDVISGCLCVGSLSRIFCSGFVCLGWFFVVVVGWLCFCCCWFCLFCFGRAQQSLHPYPALGHLGTVIDIYVCDGKRQKKLLVEWKTNHRLR